MANTTAAIMALPAPLESIRLVGDEDKHATLLYFGETSTLSGEALTTLKDSVAMATQMLFPFVESVVDVARLGSDVPPALVAKLSDANLSQVRNLFMMNPAVKGYQGNAEQFPSFTPHVTLAHPDFADEAIIRALMRQIYRVRFDRLSVWWNDERFDYALDLSSDPGSMSDAVDNFLAKHAVDDEDYFAHHGVKGQKWGVAKATRASGSAQAASGAKLAKSVLVDQHYAKKAAAIAGLSVVGLGAAALAPAVIPASVVLSAGGATVLSAKIALASSVATRVAYVQNYTSYAKRAKARQGSVAHANVLETKNVGQIYKDLTPEKANAANLLIDAYSRGIEFANNATIQSGWSSMTPTERSVVLFLASGTDVTVAHAIAATDMSTVDDFLEQHGVKGQKWGVRRAVNAATGLVSRSRTETPGAHGLISRTGSADQIAQDRISAKLASSGVKSLSNADIQSYARRLQLTKDLDRALAEQSAAQKAASQSFIKKFVKSQASRQTDRVVNKALDVAVEKALESAGLKLGKKGFSPDSADLLVKTASRLQPKKK